MIELNLIPDVKLQLLKTRRQQAAVISASIIATVAAGGLVAMMALYVFGGQELVKSKTDSDTAKQMKVLQAVPDLSETLTVQQQLSSIKGQQDSKLISSRVFDVLTATIPTDKNKVSITTASLDTETTTLTLEGEAANGYEALEVFKKTIADTTFSYLKADEKERTTVPVVTEISDSERSYGENSSGARVLRFKLVLTYSDELFTPSTKSININPPESKTVTDSATSVPKSLFTDKATPEPKGDQ